MKRFLRWFTLLAFVCLGGAAISYAGARVKVGQLLGEANHAFTGRSISFGKDSIPGVGQRNAWTVSWSTVRMPGTTRATIWVSPTGGIIATLPANLEDRIDAYLRSREP
jgi:hypothetical protein